jgi:hypothetical protein
MLVAGLGDPGPDYLKGDEWDFRNPARRRCLIVFSQHFINAAANMHWGRVRVGVDAVEIARAVRHTVTPI